ncbi:metallophosphoesterase N-terminal domain-containing protein, partial [Xanthomonas fragariae]|uniref:metallophosphoesterase N-terminal domain-containing protein n=1 Tax=Xanthomonas fragariae TaxID=48664 RepID=UPI0026585713
MQLRFALLALGLLAGSARARDAVVNGIVYEERDGRAGRSADEPGIADVTVSNGEQLVRTDAQGRYRLPVRDGQTVFVIKPGDRSFVPAADGLPGFWRHYAPSGSPKRNYRGIAATGRNTHHWDFALTVRASAAADGFQMLVFADSQPASLTDVGYYQRDIVAPIIGKTSAKLGTTLGDVVSNDLSLYPTLNKVTAQLGVPWFHVPGNHDLNFDAGDDAHSLDSWRAIYGPDTYAVEEANASFVFLDDVIYKPGGKPAYVGGLREDQFVFLQAYLAQLPRDRLLVLGMHIPLFDAAPGQETFRHADRSGSCA